jgi:hypothetical protein
MSEKLKSVSPSAMQVKNREKTIGIEEKLSVIMLREKGERIIDICHMLHSLMVPYIKFVIMLTDIKKVLSQELKCLCSKATTVLTVPKTVDVSLLLSYCIRNNKYII